MSESEAIAVAVIVVVVAAIFGSWALAWRARRRRQAALWAPAVPAGLGTAHSEHRVLSLATTRADAPLERIAVAGLGLRSDALLGVHEEGLLLSLAGRGEPVFIPRDRLLGVGHAEWALDRGSGGARIVLVRWRIGDGDEAVEVDTALRGPDPAALVAAIQPLVLVAVPSSPANPSGAPE